MLTKQFEHEVKDYIRANPEVGRIRLENEFELTQYDARRLLKEVRNEGNVSSARPEAMKSSITFPEPDKRSMSIEEFQQQYDVRTKVFRGLEDLADEVIADNDFRIELGIGNETWRKVKSLPEFKNFQINVRNKLFWANTETQEIIRRRMIIL